MTIAEHLSKQYDAEIESLRSRVLEMGGLVETQIRGAIESFVEGDEELAERVMTGDHQVNGFEVSIDDSCGQIIVKRQPAARDLRLIMAISKIVTDLERVGDEAEKIARMAKSIHGRGMMPAERLPEMRHVSDIAVRMLRQSLDAFARLDVAAAAEVVRLDMGIDAEFRSILRQLITHMMEDPRTISTALEVVWIAKAIERIGDHAKNLAEQVIYIVKGTDVRHTTLAQIEQEASS